CRVQMGLLTTKRAPSDYMASHQPDPTPLPHLILENRYHPLLRRQQLGKAKPICKANNCASNGRISPIWALFSAFELSLTLSAMPQRNTYHSDSLSAHSAADCVPSKVVCYVMRRPLFLRLRRRRRL